MITFHKILRGCEEGDRESRHLFLTDYTPIIVALVGVSLPGLAGTANQLWRDTLETLAAHNFERLRSFDHQSEREFLLDLRVFVLDCGAQRLDPSQDVAGAPKTTAATLRELLKGLPLAHQQIVFSKLSGYSDATIEKIYTVTAAVAQQGFERLRAQYASLLGSDRDVCLWPAAWSQVRRDALASRTESCPPLRQYVRMLDGQISWDDKEPLEHHMTACLHCLERWTALREVVHWRREARPRPKEEIDELVSCLPLQTRPKQREPFLRRMFS